MIHILLGIFVTLKNPEYSSNNTDASCVEGLFMGGLVFMLFFFFIFKTKDKKEA